MISIITTSSNRTTTRRKDEVLILAQLQSDKEKDLVVVNEITNDRNQSYSYFKGELVGYVDNKFFNQDKVIIV